MFESVHDTLFFAILGSIIGVLVGILFAEVCGAIIGAMFGVFSGLSISVIFGGIILFIIYFGEWSLMGEKIASLATWGLRIGGGVGALAGFLMGAEMSRDWDV